MADEMERLGKYRIVRRLGVGMIAASYRAVQEPLDRDVLLKVLHPHLSEDPDLVERFKREARVLANERHENLVQVFDAGETEGRLYLAQEFVRGRSLKEVLEAEGPLSGSSVKRIARDILSVLTFLHRKEILHRDVKPSNILVRQEDGKVLLTDFGLARSSKTAGLTREDDIVGTPEYLAPELFRGKPYSPETDLYGFGITLYECLTGRNPFTSKHLSELIHKVLNETPPPLDDRLPSLDEILLALVEGMISRDPRARGPAARRFLSQESKGTGIGVHRMARNTVIGILIASLVLVLGILLRPRIPSPGPEMSSTLDTLVLYAPNPLELDPPSEPEANPGEAVTWVEPDEHITSDLESDLPPETTPQARSEGLPLPLSRLSVSVHPGADVYIGDAYMGTTPPNDTFALSPGEYEILIKNPEYPDLRRRVTLKGDSLTPLSVNLLEEFVMLEVLALPWANVILDDSFYGTTPITIPIPIEPGEHHILLEKDDTTESRRFSARAGDTIKIDVDFR
jgi:serine/threonine-protein kinase